MASTSRYTVRDEGGDSGHDEDDYEDDPNYVMDAEEADHDSEMEDVEQGGSGHEGEGSDEDHEVEDEESSEDQPARFVTLDEFREWTDDTPHASPASLLLSILRRYGFSAREQAMSGGADFRYSPSMEPTPTGKELLASQDFGRVQPKGKGRNILRAMDRARCGLALPSKIDLFQGMVPNSRGVVVAEYGDNVYSGQFSADSSFYYTCVQDFRMHIYDTTRPITQRLRYPSRGTHTTTMHVTKTIDGVGDGWTITDSHLSPDNERLAYAVMGSKVYLAKVNEEDQEQMPLEFGDSSTRWDVDPWLGGFRIWSCRFSADGKEIVAGGSGNVMVYDLVANRRSVKINAHADDVNSCCWADTSSGNVLISASDDSFLKVWDRRSLGSYPKPSGFFIGHTQGITYVSPKGDGRYLISNGKDQTLKLWDLRMMASEQTFQRVKGREYGIPNFDYRTGVYHRPPRDNHPDDCSVMSYRGHTVLRTLIRCHFSPAETTGSQYIYSGSADGVIHIWSVDGRLVQRINSRKSMPITKSPSGPEPELDPYEASWQMGQNVVRDVSWHPQQPVLMSCAWGDRFRKSHVSRHEWKGLGKFGGKLEDWAEKSQRESAETPTPNYDWEGESFY